MSNKTSDKNVGSIEDDVKRCNELIKVEHANWIGISNQLAISHILAEREQMIVEKKKYTIRLTDEQYRKVIENAQMDTSNDTVVAHRFAVMQQQINEKDKQIQELEHLNISFEKGIKRLKKKIKEVEGVNKEEVAKMIAERLQKDYIPKQVVIDKVNEINKKYEDSKNENGESPYYYPDFTIRILQELLEGEK